MDVQYITAMAPLSPTTFWHTKDFFPVWLTNVAYTINPPLVHSISWGIEERFVSPAEFDAFEIAAMRLGLMGVTIVVASGDDGVHSQDVRQSLQNCGYSASFPATSRYVLSIGGTMVSCMAIKWSYIPDFC